ncbi:MAG: hypothetical protein JOZ33_15740, partial [Acidobacteriaceae bacterium]|nr:hypothetical protein [Acidobacteriaceae bacterium]
SARAEAREAALLLEEPFGRFGAMTPTGHAAVYLSDVCAQSPTKLRACMPGENGVVLSRYHHVGGYDWLAIPLIPYLYAVDDASQIPSRADLGLETRLRNRYRREHLMDLVPDDPNEEIPRGEWIQLIGSAYDRRIFGYAIETSEEQDQALISDFNERRNKAHFNFFFNNCANFTANVMNYYYPHSIRRNFIADAGLMTPKHAAKSLVRFEKKHPEIENASFMIEQVPGIIPRSTPVDGLAEALLKSKKYVLPITLAQPFATVGLAVVYFGGGGRFHPDPHVTIFDATRQAVPGISSEPKPASPGAASTLAGFAGDESSGTELGTHSASLRAQ